MVTSRSSKQPRKGTVDRRPGGRASPANTPSSLPNDIPPQASFLPLSTRTIGTRTQDAPQDRTLQTLAGLTGTIITLLTKSGHRYEGIISSTSPDGDTTSVILKDVKEISKPGTPFKDSFIASANIDNQQSRPADTKLPNSDTFRKDADISKNKVAQERDLQAWQSSDTPPAHHDWVGDEIPVAATNTLLDQFATDEQIFGVTTSFDEDLYTTKLYRSCADYKEAQRVASKIIGSVTNNPHIAEERNLTFDDSGVNEEDKYGAVVRGSNVYIPSGAQKQQQQSSSAAASAVNTPPPKTDIPKVSVNGPDGTVVAPKEVPPASPALSTPFVSKPPTDPLPAFYDFVANERRRLTQKKQALVKSEMDKRKAELLKISQTFKLNKPIPDDLAPVLVKDVERQRRIREIATRDATAATARTIDTVGTLNPSPSVSRVPQIPTSAKVALRHRKRR